jgi:molybdopterin-containing oxidoreductase family iron-sulfur binding subunit
MTRPSEPTVYQIGLPASPANPAASGRSPRRPLWRSLDELAGDETFLEALEYEYPAASVQGLDLTSRRQFLRLMGASLALSGIAGCAVQPLESIVPYVEQPELIEPGKPLFFATAAPCQGFATGVLVRSREGRPIKIEGNPSHPSSRGATDAFAQAEMLSLYDPDRSQVVLYQGRVNTWERFQTLAVDLRGQLAKSRGRGLRLLTQTVTSPTLADQLGRLLKQFPEARWQSYEPVSRDDAREGMRRAFGEPLELAVHLDRADVIVSLEDDFLAWGPDQLRLAREFAQRRDPDGGPPGAARTMNRVYVAESTPSLSGSVADHRLAIPSREIGPLAMALTRELKVEGLPAGDGNAGTSPHAAWISAVARELDGHRGRSVVLAGESQPAAVHVLAYALNQALGNIGKTITFHTSHDQGPANQMASLVELVRDIRDGKVETLLILGGNPVYDTPADLDFAAALSGGKLGLSIHLGTHEDETAELCHWHIPQAHFLEAWGDLRASDGTVTVQQPLIAPLYQGRSALEVVGNFLGEPARSPLETIRDYWKRQSLPGEFEAVWRRALVEGLVPGTVDPAREMTFKREALAGLAQAFPPPGAGGGLELVFRPDPTIWDGRYANNGWLQELPKPLTRLTWGNAALVSPARARELGLSSEDEVELRIGGHSLRMPVWVHPGQADASITVHLGHGRWRAGRVGTGIGFNANRLRTSDAPWFRPGLELVRTSGRQPLAPVQHHHAMAGRDLVRSATLEEYRQHGDFAHEPDREHVHAMLYPDQPRGGEAENAWGMAIDLSRCIGCGACVVACQAENNIPIVGKEEVLRSREMHWLRIDRYYEGDEANPATHFQPVACMHCEKAPCEVVCPVGATTHSDEGLNEMTYNRCVGTRYCSNNCPYKVRRFNFFEYNDNTSESLKLLRNPEVTVRSRGVMEKCTYCVQRINHARINAKIEGRPVAGDEVVTACQGACPSRAIIFGNLRDPQAAVVQAKASSRNYALLGELNTVPRTTYLASIRNPNPAIGEAQHERSDTADGHHPS